MELDPDVLVREKVRRLAGRDLLTFLQYVWWMPQPLKIGRHTRAIADRLTRAIDDWRDGKSTFLLVNVPFRHGKSDLVSRALPAFFLGRCADRQPDIIMSGYGADLVETFAHQSKNIIRSPQYQAVFPGVEIDSRRDRSDKWGVTGSAGTVTAVGLGGAITGKGGHLIIVDDYCKDHAEAYSDKLRDETWKSFSIDLMTRRNSPASIVIVCATPWHTDDVTGRIKYQMKHDPSFPRFEELNFPARKEGPGGWDILFPEMFDEAWYDSQRATLGPTDAAALLDCNPIGAGNRTFHPEWLHTYNTQPDPEKLNIYLLVDSANTKRKDRDTDFTSMQVWGFGRDRNYYLLDAIRDRLDLAGRTDALFDFIEKWHPKNVFWEQVGAMSDVQHVKLEMDARGYHFPIRAIPQSVPKKDRIGWLVPLFEASRIWLPPRLLRLRDDGMEYDFTADFIQDEFSTYPAARHDDMLDCMANLQHPHVVASSQFPVDRTSLPGYRRDANRTTGHAWRPWKATP